MKCETVRVVVKSGKGIIAPAAVTEFADHVKTCASCHDLVLLERLAPAIIKAASAPEEWNALNASSATLACRIRMRIQEMREQRLTSWESAVESMRGWLTAFAVVTIILVIISVQWRPQTVTSDLSHDLDEVVTLNLTDEIID
jgi:hypothetical protein